MPLRMASGRAWRSAEAGVAWWQGNALFARHGLSSLAGGASVACRPARGGGGCAGRGGVDVRYDCAIHNDMWSRQAAACWRMLPQQGL